MFLVVQQISVHWTKKSRGGVGASKRNAVPEAFPLRDMPSDDYPLTLLYSSHNYSEDDDFDNSKYENEIRSSPLGQQLNFDIISIRIRNGEANIRYVYSMMSVGAPERSVHPKTFTLKPDDWGRVICNGRFGWANDWRYHKTVFNIAFVNELSENLFMDRTPPKLIRDMANLW